LGADESQLDRLADGDFVPVIKELLKKAAAGDAASINVLGFLAHDECLWGRSTEQDTSYEQDQLASAARSLAPADAAWFSAGLKANNAQRRKFAPVCSDLINQEQILVWLKDRAAQGDGASLWVLARYAVPDMAAYERSMIAAAEAGFPQAQLELAWEMLQHLPEAQGVSTGQLSAVDLLRAAAEKLPDAQASLAICEYSGCEGTAPDVSAALADAHAAALKGRISGLLNMAPHLATGQLSPDEIAAWRLVDAFLELSGCGASNHSVEGVKTVIAAASASDVSSGARRLAAQYWRDNGQDMMASRGCGS
jgi:hypothetical protein